MILSFILLQQLELSLFGVSIERELMTTILRFNECPHRRNSIFIAWHIARHSRMPTETWVYWTPSQVDNLYLSVL